MATKPVMLSKHAQHMLLERGIELGWVQAVVDAPDILELDRADPARLCAFGRIEEFGGRWLRVVYTESAIELRVITAFFDRGAEKRR